MLVSPLANIGQKRPFKEPKHSSTEKGAKANGSSVCSASASPGSGGIDVELNIYDVTHGNVIHSINELFAHSMSPLKLGGVFHVGVKVMNIEWAYGWKGSGTGVLPGQPKSEQHHRFRETVHLAKTKLSEREIGVVIRRLAREYQGCDYSLIERNCCHFAEDLCHKLGVGSIPAWVHRLGRAYDGLQKVTKSLASLSSAPSVSCSSPASEGKEHHGNCDGLQKVPQSLSSLSPRAPLSCSPQASSEKKRPRDKCRSKSKGFMRGWNANKEIICM